MIIWIWELLSFGITEYNKLLAALFDVFKMTIKCPNSFVDANVASPVFCRGVRLGGP